MCKRITCQDCGKFTWTGCGQHITQVLEGLPLEQICKCDDDFDSEKKWQIPPREDIAPMIDLTSTSTTPTQAELVRPVPRYPLPFPSSSPSVLPSTSTSSFTTTATTAHFLPGHAHNSAAEKNTSAQGPSATSTSTRGDGAAAHCPDPSPVEYRLSKISSTSATVAAVRMTQQAAALEELRRIKQRKEQQLKEANESALQKLLQGLSDATTPTQNPDGGA